MTIPLHFYDLITALGASWGLWRVYRSFPAEKALAGLWRGLIALLGGLMGSRMGYILLHWDFYSQHPSLIPRFWLGGYNAFGAIAGIILFTVAMALIYRVSVCEQLDHISRLAAPLSTAVLIGLWGEGIAYGRRLPSGAFLALPAPDESGGTTMRFPLQLIAALSSLLVLLLVEHWNRKARPGRQFGWIGLSLSLILAVTSLWRDDPAPVWYGMRADLLLSVFFVFLFLSFLLAIMNQTKKEDKIAQNKTNTDETIIFSNHTAEDTMPDLNLDTAKVREILTSFIREWLHQAGYGKVVVGLSGGLDSTLACYLAAEAIGAENVLGVRMPYRTSSPESMAHAQLVYDALAVHALTIPITEMVEPLFNLYPEMDGRRRGNIMARQRMIVLFDQSEAFKGLVLGTGNKTEYLLGYTTLYGDSACAFNPLGDLYKTQVRQLAREMGVPEEIISKAPSADLWVGQTDEGELGFTYADVDQVLFMLVEEHRSPQAVVAAGFSQTFVLQVMDRVRKTQFKRELPPIAKITDQEIDYRFLEMPVD